jgi:hypothetical protein
MLLQNLLNLRAADATAIVAAAVLSRIKNSGWSGWDKARIPAGPA